MGINKRSIFRLLSNKPINLPVVTCINMVKLLFRSPLLPFIFYLAVNLFLWISSSHGAGESPRIFFCRTGDFPEMCQGSTFLQAEFVSCYDWPAELGNSLIQSANQALSTYTKISKNVTRQDVSAVLEKTIVTWPWLHMRNVRLTKNSYCRAGPSYFFRLRFCRTGTALIGLQTREVPWSKVLTQAFSTIYTC